MKVYKFTGDYSKLKQLGYNRNPFLEIDGFQNWGKATKNYSIIILNYVSVKVFNKNVGLTYVEPEIIKPYIKDLIKNNLVEVADF
jgi:hypothetical protein